MWPIIEQVGKEKGLHYIFNGPDSGLVWADASLDITTEGLRYGFRVKVIAMPSHAHWRTPAALKVVGPQYFGYEGEFVPVEVRMRG